MHFKVFMESAGLEMPFATGLGAYEDWDAAWGWWQERMADDPFGKTIVQWWHRQAKAWREAWWLLICNVGIQGGVHDLQINFQMVIAELAVTLTKLVTTKREVFAALGRAVKHAKALRANWKIIIRQHRQLRNALGRSSVRDFNRFLDAMIQQLEAITGHIGF